MFGFGIGELLFLAAIALIAIGPKQLPEVARVVAKMINELRRATSDITRSVMEVRDEANPKNWAADFKKGFDPTLGPKIDTSPEPPVQHWPIAGAPHPANTVHSDFSQSGSVYHGGLGSGHTPDSDIGHDFGPATGQPDYQANDHDPNQISLNLDHQPNSMDANIQNNEKAEVDPHQMAFKIADPNQSES